MLPRLSNRPLFARTTPRQGSSRRRLFLQNLEDRCVMATFSVTSAADDGAAGTLRWAVGQANLNAGPDTINFASAVSGGTIVLTGGQLTLTDSALTTIDGGLAGVTLDGNHATRLIEVNVRADAALNRLTIKNGYAQDNNGGGILSDGTLAVADSTFIDNAAKYGGGIFNGNVLTVTGCTFRDNTAFEGGGIRSIGHLNVATSSFLANDAEVSGGGISSGGIATVNDCRFLENSAGSTGGGIFSVTNLTVTASTFENNRAYVGAGIMNSGTLEVITCTFSENVADSGGGIASSNSTAEITASTFRNNSATYGGGFSGAGSVTASTFVGNTATTTGGGLYVTGFLTLSASTLSNNSANLGAGIHAAGGKSKVRLTSSIVADSMLGNLDSPCVNNLLVGDGAVGGLADGVNGNIVVPTVAALGLDPAGLKDNGGPTPTIALLPTSPAIGHGALVIDPLTGQLRTTDQRGQSRNSDPDIGAFETQAATVQVAISGGTYNGAAYAATATVTGPSGNLLASANDPALSYTYFADTVQLAAAPTNAGSYSVVVTFSSVGYRTAVSDAIAFSIAKADAAVVYSGYVGGSYDTASHTRNVSVTGVGSDGTLFTDSLSGANAGSYSKPWSFGSGNYNSVSGTLAFDIAKANAVVAFSGSSGGTYDTAAHMRNVIVTGVGSDGTLFTDSLSGTNAGSYSKPWAFSSGNYNSVSGTLAFDIAKANAAVVYSGYTGGTYDAASHTRSVAVTGVGSDGTLFTDTLAGTNASSYSKPWSFSSGNYNSVGGTLAFDIAKANAAVAYSGYTGGTYDAATHTRNVTVTGVGNDGTLFTDALSGTNAGSYSKPWAFSSGNYSSVSGTLAFDIAKANVAVAYSGYSGGTYDAASHTRSVTVTGVGSEGILFTDSLSGTNSWSYSKPWSFSSGNYSSVSGTLAFDIAKAASDLSLSVSHSNPRFGVDSVTLRVDLAATPAGATGIVAFYDGVNLLGRSAIVDGSATLMLGATGLTAGSHTLRASYSGDGNFAGSEDQASVTVQSSSGVTLDSSGRLAIRGTAGHDIIHVGRFFNTIYVFTWMNITDSTFTQECASDDHQTDSRFQLHLFSAASVSSIEIRTLDSSDLASVDLFVTVPANIDGGQGDDLLFGGSGNDIITDMAGNNWISAGAGNDVIVTGSGGDVILSGSGNDLVRAGGGNDSLQGGAGDDILLGGDGKDSILGGEGRDLLIGGNGADRLVGEQEEDILVGGFTVYDNADLALFSIMNEWTNSTSHTTRRNNLMNGTGQTGGHRLIGDDGASQTVFNDNEVDTLTGGQGTDWFFANRQADGGGLLDVVSDKGASELWSDTDA